MSSPGLRKNVKVIGVKISCHTFVNICCIGLPCESLRHKSNTFHTNISTLHTFISIAFTETCIDETNKTQQKVRGSKFMFRMSSIHANTCIQITTPLRNRWWFRWQSWCYAAALLATRGYGQRLLLPEYSSAEYASAGYLLYFRGLLRFSVYVWAA